MALSSRTTRSSVNSGAWRALAWGGIVLQAIALVVVWQLARWNGLWVIGGFLAASLVFMLMQDRLPSLLSLLVVLAALLNAGGWAWNWYDQFVWFDEFIHCFTAFVGLAALGHVLWRSGHIRAEPGTAGFVLRIGLLGLGLGIAWEIAEAFFLNLHVTDTSVDLLVDTIGAALGGVLAGWVIERQERPA